MFDGLRISAVGSADWSRQRERRRDEDQASKTGGRRKFTALLDEEAGPVRLCLPGAVTVGLLAAAGTNEDKVDAAVGPAAQRRPAPPPNDAVVRLQIRQKLNQYRKALSLIGLAGSLRAN